MLLSKGDMAFYISILILFLSSCVRYSIPMEECCQPSCANTETIEQPLSDVLEIDWEDLL